MTTDCANCGHELHGADCHGPTFDSVTGEDVGECDCDEPAPASNATASENSNAIQENRT